MTQPICYLCEAPLVGEALLARPGEGLRPLRSVILERICLDCGRSIVEQYEAMRMEVIKVEAHR